MPPPPKKKRKSIVTCMYIAPSSGHELLNLNLHFKLIQRRFEGFFFRSEVRMQHFLKDWWKFIQIHQYYTGWPRNNGTVDTVDFSGLCSNQQLFSLLCWIEHLFPIIITPRSSNLVENFLFYETFLMDCHFRDLPDFQSVEARWQINGKSQKWQSIRNYS